MIKGKKIKSTKVKKRGALQNNKSTGRKKGMIKKIIKRRINIKIIKAR